MKIIQFKFLSCVLFCTSNIFSNELSKEEVHLVIKSDAALSAHSISKALHSAGTDKGELVVLVSKLKKIGFGKNPPNHPNHRDLTEEEKKTCQLRI